MAATVAVEVLSADVMALDSAVVVAENDDDVEEDKDVD